MITNIEKIKAMDSTEMSEFLHRFSCENCAYHRAACCSDFEVPDVCVVGIEKWLESEAEE